MADNLTAQYQSNVADFDTMTNDYINQLLGYARGDRDLAVRMLTRDHNLALGSNDQQTAQFLESVSDKLEERIGRIPYDYEIATTRTREDLARTQELTNRNRDLALSRLAEDEQTWRQEFGKTSDDTRQAERESLSQRGLLSGTREGAEGLAGREVARTEQDLSTTLQGFERALGRERKDIGTQAEDTLFQAQREADRELQDLKTQARRDTISAQDTLAFGKEQQDRLLKQREQDLERAKLKRDRFGTTYFRDEAENKIS